MKEETKEKLKQLGLEYAEILTETTVDALFEIIDVLVQDSENKLDDLILPALPTLKSKLLELVENIDLK